jgi:hypothetical protein
MAIYRTSKNNKSFVMLDKTSLEDSRLSFAAKGLHAYLMSKPDNWKPRLSQLIKACSNGRDYIKAAMKNLEDTGYVWKRQVRDERGKFIDWEYVIFETPRTENPFLEMPKTEKPETEKPTPENPPYNNNDSNNNYYNNNPPIVPPEENQEENTPEAEDADSYDEFIKIHPAGTQGKIKGKRNWERCLKDGWTVDQLLGAAKRYARYIAMCEEMGDDIKVKWPQGFLNPQDRYFEPWIPGNHNYVFERALTRYNKRRRKGVAPVSDFSNIQKGEWKRHG